MDKKKAATEIVRVLQKKGYEALFAGGCVRDQIRKVKCEDYDIATSCKPDEVQKLFPKTLAVGKQFGVIIVLVNGVPFEVTTFRSEGPYKDGRHPSSIQFTSLKEDAKRRDFTVNGLYFDPISKKFHDYVKGVSDIKKKIIRTIGDPNERFSEDKLRILRAIRFASTLGYKIEKKTWETIKQRAHEINDVSQERVRDELIKMLTRKNAGLALTLLNDSGLLKHILPEIEKMKGVKQPPDHHPEGDVFVHTRMLLDQLKNPSVVLAFAALLHDVGKPDTYQVDDKGIHFYGHSEKGVEIAENLLKRLRFSNQEIAQINTCVANHMKFMNVKQMRPAKIKRFIMTETFQTELELHKIDCLASHKKLDNYRFMTKKLKEVQKESQKGKLPLSGEDLLKLGFKPGPIIGQILHEAQDEWLEGRIKTQEEAIRFVKKNFKIPPEKD